MRIFKLNKLNQWAIILEAGGQYPFFIPLEDFINRMRKLGWNANLNSAGDNYLLNIKTKDGKYYSLSVANKGWRLTNGYRQTYRQLRAQCPETADFVFKHQLEIPANFDIQTQRKKITQPQYNTKTIPLFNQLPKDLETYEIFINNQWINPHIVDWENKTIMDKNGNIYNLPDRNIKIRKKIS